MRGGWVEISHILDGGLRDARLRYTAALVFFAIALALRFALHPLLGTLGPFGFFLLSATAASLAGGFGPGLLATALGGAAACYFFVPSPATVSAGFAGPLMVYSVVGAGISAMGGLHRRRTAALHDSQQRLEAIFSQAAAGLAYTLADGAIVLANDRFAGMVDRNPAALRGEALGSLVEPSHRPAFDEAMASTMAGASGLDTREARTLRPDGKPVWLQFAFSPVKGDDGVTHGLTALVLDVTSRRDAESQLMESDRRLRETLELERLARSDAERANRVKDEFLSTLSHELRTPLNAILGWTHLMQETSPRTVTEMERGMAVIERNARAQAQIVDDLLDMSRIVTGRMRLDIGAVSLARLLAGVVEEMAPAFDAKGLELSREIAPDISPISGDSVRLRQVVANLLSNALKFTPAGGRVSVALRREGGEARIVVSDTGQGIGSAFLPYVFENFRQADQSHRRAHGGLGLGLALAKSLTELHGGHVSASSPGENRGAEFVVGLPLPGAAGALPPRQLPGTGMQSVGPAWVDRFQRGVQ